MTPGEIDALVAEKVMGWKPNQECTDENREIHEYYDGWICTACEATGGWGSQDDHDTGLHRYSTDIAAAWEVAEKHLHPDWDVDLYRDKVEGGSWECELVCWERKIAVTAVADTAPMAICLAALKAVGEKDTE